MVKLIRINTETNVFEVKFDSGTEVQLYIDNPTNVFNNATKFLEKDNTEFTHEELIDRYMDIILESFSYDDIVYGINESCGKIIFASSRVIVDGSLDDKRRAALIGYDIETTFEELYELIEIVCESLTP